MAEGGGLLNRYRVVKPYRGFESLRLRHPPPYGLRVAGHPEIVGRRVSPEAAQERRETVATCSKSATCSISIFHFFFSDVGWQATRRPQGEGCLPKLRRSAGRLFPLWYVYFLELNNGDIYIGSTDDLRRRVASHQSGHVISTSKYLPVVLRSYVAVGDEVTARGSNDISSPAPEKPLPGSVS